LIGAIMKYIIIWIWFVSMVTSVISVTANYKTEKEHLIKLGSYVAYKK